MPLSILCQCTVDLAFDFFLLIPRWPLCKISFISLSAGYDYFAAFKDQITANGKLIFRGRNKFFSFDRSFLLLT